MVGRRIQNQAVGIEKLHTGNHTTHLFTSRKHIHLLHDFLTREQHTSQESFHLHFVALTILTQPVYQIQVAVEVIRIVERQISRCNRHTPVIMSSLRLTVTVYNLEQRSHGTRVVAQEYNLIAFLHGKVHVAEQNSSVFCFGTQS